MSTSSEIAPGPGFAWAGQAVEIGQIDEALRQAWREEAARAASEQDSLAARTNVLNLIVHTSSAAELEQVSAAIGRLGVQHPSRTLLLLAEPAAEESGLAAWVNTNVAPLPGTSRRLLFEQVTIAARGEAARYLAPVIDPLLIAELPNFLWWLGEPPTKEPRCARMLDLVNRLIVDSASFADLGRGLHELAELTVIPYGVAVSDFAWGRLRPWRELIAQFFDPTDYAANIAAIDRVDITYEPEGPHPFSGLSESILALGWACSRLGWLVGRPAARDTDGSLHWQFGTGWRTVEVTVRPNRQGDGVTGLRRMTLATGGQHPATFHVYREGGTHLATAVESSSAPHLERVMRASEPDENELLLQALNQFGRDRTYDGALVFAAQLAHGIG